MWAWCAAPLRSRRKPWHPRGTTRVPTRPAGAVVRLREQLHADLRIPRRAGRHRRSAPRARRHDAVPHPGARPGRRARRPRRHRPGPDRLRQDPRLRHPDPRPGRGRRSPPSRRAGAGADPRAGRADHRRAGPARRGGRCPRGRRLRRRSDAAADLGAQPWPRRARRHAGPPDRPHPSWCGLARRRQGRHGRRSRPHGRPRLPAAGRVAPAAHPGRTSRCSCSRPRSTGRWPA